MDATGLVVVVPVGPNCRPEFVADTLDSVDFYCPGRRLIVLDDSGTGVGAKVAASRHRAEVVEVGSLGLAGGLYLSLSLGFQRALAEPFDVLLRLDTDALVAGDGFLRAARSAFSEDARLGSLGSYRVGFDGHRRSFRSAARRLAWELIVQAPRRPQRAACLWRLLLPALRHGYRFGESIMGGVAVYSRAAVEGMEQAGMLGRPELGASRLQEDMLFALALRSRGYRLGEFGARDDDLPMGVKHRGLPAEPAELLARGKSLIHSTKSHGQWDEAQTRAAFAAARVATAG